jgi:signal transduction histidine kinase/HAMP domain-containing protein
VNDAAARAALPAPGLPPGEIPARFAIRTRLLATFLALLLLTIVLAVTGIAGMRHNQRALDDFEAGVMPEIARVLELAEKVSQLAAVAPSIADSDLQSPSRNDSQLVRVLLGEIRRLSGDLPTQADSRLEATAMLDGIDRDLTSLLALSSERRRQQAQLRSQRDTLDALGDQLFRNRVRVQRDGPSLQSIWSTLVAAELADEYTTLGRSEADVEALWVFAQQAGEDRRLPALAAALQALCFGDDGTFQLRRRQLRTERQLSTVVQLMRSHSTQLGARASAYVAELRKVSTERRDTVRRTVASGASALVLVSALSVLTALAGALYVQRVLRDLQAMTRTMTRLAGGDVAQPSAAISRPDEIGELARAFQVFRDHLLEKQRLTQGLHAQGRLLESVFHGMNDGLSVYDAGGPLVVWNQKFESLLPFAPGVLRRGVPIGELNAALPAGATWRAVAAETAVRLGRHRIAASAELHLPGGRVLEMLSHPMPDGGWVAVCRDLSARRAMEAQLRQAQRMEVLGQLTGGIAHDFNNFLSAILGNLELLRNRLLDDERVSALATRAHKAAESAAGLSRRLLVFARRQPLEVESVCVDDMLAEMQDLVEYSVGPAIEVRIDASGADTALSVQADRGQLENALLNLALNSAAAMPSGGTLTLSVAHAAHSACVVPAGEAVVVRVHDTGHGMPAEVQARVAEPFFTTKAPGQGSGLGLAIVDGFMRQCGGSLVLHSAEGRGTTAELWLPASHAGAPAPLPRAAAHARGAAARVLLVEDDDSVRATAAALLDDLGATVTAVASEHDALACMVAHGPFDLLLSDVMLGPGGDGVALWHRIAHDWPQQRIVLSSGLPPEVHARRADWPVAAAFLPKPFTRKSLEALIA